MVELLGFLLGLVAVLRVAIKADVDVSTLVNEKLKEWVNRQNKTDQIEITVNGTSYWVPEMTSDEIEIAAYTGRLDAIKAYKDRTGESLLHSKLAVDRDMFLRGRTFR